MGLELCISDRCVGVGTSSWRQGRKNGIRNCQWAEQEGENDWTVQKIQVIKKRKYRGKKEI